MMGIDMGEVEGILSRAPVDWMAEDSREFAIEFIRYTRNELIAS